MTDNMKVITVEELKEELDEAAKSLSDCWDRVSRIMNYQAGPDRYDDLCESISQMVHVLRFLDPASEELAKAIFELEDEDDV